MAEAALEGMRTALLVPLRDGSSTVAVLELLTRAAVAPDPELTASIEAIALQLGHYWHLQRLGAEPRWRLGRV